MKPNLLFVQTTHLGINAEIEKFCECFCDSHYVYLVRPNSPFREDSPAGLRFLSNPLDQLPGFAAVRATVAIADPAAADHLQHTYPGNAHVFWDPEDESYLPDLLVSLLNSNVYHENFRLAQEIEFNFAI